MKLGSKLLLTGMVVLTSLTVSFALAEVLIRALAAQPTALSHQDRYGLALHYPGITRYLPQFGHRVSFNRAGMRDREHSEAKPEGVFRILVLGDSFMEAVQVPFEQSFPAMLEQALAEMEGKRVEVVNAGVSGWGTDDHLRYLTHYGLKYSPDLVLIAMTLHNDISDNLREQWHTLDEGELVEKQVEPMSFLTYKKVELKAFIATRFQLYQLWRKVRHGGEMRRVGRDLNVHVRNLFREPAPAEITRGFTITDHLLAAVQKAAGTVGGDVAVVMLPIRYQLSDSIFAEFARSAEAGEQEMRMGRPQQAIGEIGARLGIRVIDLLPRFRQWTLESDEALFLEWDGHWNATGHRVAAEAVAKALRHQGEREPARAPQKR